MSKFLVFFKRPCRRCDLTFRPTSKGDRLCQNCKKKVTEEKKRSMAKFYAGKKHWNFCKKKEEGLS